MTNAKQYSSREEKANALSHFLALTVVVAAVFPFSTQLILLDNLWAWVSYLFMFLGLSASYLASTLYHSATEAVSKARLRKFDHAAIYLNIAGSYTPFMLYSLREEGAWGWSLFIVVWCAAVVGIALNFGKMKRNNHLKTLSYLMMGWVIVIALKPLYDVLNLQGRGEVLWWIVAEGVLYTVGALFYMFAKREFMHTVFHLFVLGAMVCHLMATWLLIA